MQVNAASFQLSQKAAWEAASNEYSKDREVDRYKVGLQCRFHLRPIGQTGRVFYKNYSSKSNS